MCFPHDCPMSFPTASLPVKLTICPMILSASVLVPTKGKEVQTHSKSLVPNHPVHHLPDVLLPELKHIQTPVRQSGICEELSEEVVRLGDQRRGWRRRDVSVQLPPSRSRLV